MNRAIGLILRNHLALMRIAGKHKGTGRIIKKVYAVGDGDTQWKTWLVRIVVYAHMCICIHQRLHTIEAVVP